MKRRAMVMARLTARFAASERSGAKEPGDATEPGDEHLTKY